MTETIDVKSAMRRVYRDALDCQNACNLSGVVQTLSRHMTLIWDEVRAAGGGTDEVNRHPAVQVFLSKLVSLTGGEFDPGTEAWNTCELRAATKFKIIDDRTDISVQFFSDYDEAMALAKRMSERHKTPYRVRPVNS